jgi:transposase
MKMYAGLDVHSKQCTYAIQDADGKMQAKGEFATTVSSIAQWVKHHGLDNETTIGMETGLVTPFVARQLKANGIEDVVVINAAEVRAKARRKTQKSDTADAFEICDGTRRNIYVSTVQLPDEQTQKLRDTLAVRRHFVTAATREINGIKSLLRKTGLGQLYKTLNSDKAFARLLSLPQIDDELKTAIEAHKRVWDAVREEIKRLDKQLEQTQQVMSAEVERLRTVPGVGPIVALTALAYFSQPSRFKNAKHAASYTGLVPQMYNSADRECYGHITKQGPNELRAMLCEAAQHAAKKNHPLHSLYRKIRNKKGHKVAVIAVAHRLARILWSMMKKQTAFDCTRYAMTDPKWNQLLQDEAQTLTNDEIAVH